MKVNEWKWLWGAVCFVAGVFLPFIVQWLATGEGEAIKFAVVAALLLTVVAGFLKNREWKQVGVFYALLGVLGFVVAEFLLILVASSWHGHAHAGRLVRANTVLLAVQTLVLAATLCYVYKYVVAAQKSTVAAQTSALVAQLQVEVARCAAVGAAVFLSDPVLTVHQFVQELKDPCARDKMEKWVQNGDVENHWLMIEITNEGKGSAMNVKVKAEWPPHVGKGDDKACAQGWMPSTQRGEEWNNDSLYFGNVPWVSPDKRKAWQNGLERDAWRIWRLDPGYKALLYFREPAGDAALFTLTWFDVFYWQEPPLKMKITKQGDKWYADWGPACNFLTDRLKQRIKEMKQVMKELMAESAK